MLLMPNKKKMATMIVASMSKKPDFVQKLGDESDTGSYELPGKSDDEKDQGLEASMESFMSALESKNAKAAVKAFKELWAQVDDDDDDHGEGDKPEVDVDMP